MQCRGPGNCSSQVLVLSESQESLGMDNHTFLYSLNVLLNTFLVCGEVLVQWEA